MLVELTVISLLKLPISIFNSKVLKSLTNRYTLEMFLLKITISIDSLLKLYFLA